MPEQIFTLADVANAFEGLSALLNAQFQDVDSRANRFFFEDIETDILRILRDGLTEAEQAADHLAIALEAKSEEDPSNPISMRTVRQVKTYAQWMRDNCRVASDAELIVVVISPRSTIDEEAQRNAEGIFYLHVDEIRKWVEDLIASLRRIRTQSVDSDQARVVAIIQEELHSIGLLLPDLLKSLKKTPLENLPNPQ